MHDKLNHLDVSSEVMNESKIDSILKDDLLTWLIEQTPKSVYAKEYHQKLLEGVKSNDIEILLKISDKLEQDFDYYDQKDRTYGEKLNKMKYLLDQYIDEVTN